MSSKEPGSPIRVDADVAVIKPYACFLDELEDESVRKMLSTEGATAGFMLPLGR